MEGKAKKLLAESLVHWHGIVARPVASGAELVGNMEELYRSIYDTDFVKLEIGEVKALAVAAGEELFDLYLTLRDRIPEWHALGLMGEGAALAIRNAMRILRYTSDIVGEVASGYPRLARGEHTYPAFEGPPGWTLMHPARADGERVMPRSGDVILVRGQLHNSAAIARIGDVDAQFSHVGIVHVDDDGQRWMVEALIEEGSTFSPLATALSHGLGRAVVFRHRDAELARRAAAYIAEHVRTSRRWIPYDFTMELEGEDCFFCSKLIRYAYFGGSGGALLLPRFGTRLAMTNRDFFERLGVTATDTFAPADFEVEPAFDLVAEWRDYRVTSSLRMQDLLMSKLFDWMDAYGYRFRDSLGMSLVALLGRISSVMPNMVKNGLVRAGLPKVPSNMTARTIATIGMLHGTAEPILRRLLALEATCIETTGRPMHPREVQAELERFRAAAGKRIGYLLAP